MQALAASLYLVQTAISTNFMIKPEQLVRKTATSDHDPNYIFVEIMPKPDNFTLSTDHKIDMDVPPFTLNHR